MSPRPIEDWLRDIQIFLGFLFFLSVALVIGVIIFAYIRATIRRKRAARIQQRDRREKFRPDGTAYPPFGRGFCDNCSGAFDKVYFLPSGTRLCPECYRAFEQS